MGRKQVFVLGCGSGRRCRLLGATGVRGCSDRVFGVAAGERRAVRLFRRSWQEWSHGPWPACVLRGPSPVPSERASGRFPPARIRCRGDAGRSCYRGVHRNPLRLGRRNETMKFINSIPAAASACAGALVGFAGGFGWASRGGGCGWGLFGLRRGGAGVVGAPGFRRGLPGRVSWVRFPPAEPTRVPSCGRGRGVGVRRVVGGGVSRGRVVVREAGCWSSSGWRCLG